MRVMDPENTHRSGHRCVALDPVGELALQLLRLNVTNIHEVATCLGGRSCDLLIGTSLARNAAEA